MTDAAPTALSRPPLSLRENFSWTLGGQVVYAASQWGMLTVLAKVGTPEMVGEFALALAVTAPVISFVEVNLSAVQATDAKREFAFADYLGFRIIGSLVALVVIALIALAGYQTQVALVILAVGIAKTVEAISEVFHGLFQQRERLDAAAKSLIAKGPLSLVALGGTTYLTGSVFWGVVALIGAWAVVLLAYDWPIGSVVLRASENGPNTSEIRPRWRRDRVVALARLTWPMAVVALVSALLPNVPRYTIERQLGEGALGMFAAMAYVVVAGRAIVLALANASRPRLARYYQAGEQKAYYRLTLQTAGIGALIGLAGVFVALFAGRQVLALLYTSAYTKHVDVFVFLMAAGGLSYVTAFLWGAATAARYLKVQAPLYAVSLGITIVASMVLVPRFGLLGAAAAVLTTQVVQFGGMGLIVLHAGRRCRPEVSER